MTRVLEANDEGTLTLPADLLGDGKPHTRYVVEGQDGQLFLRPEEKQQAKPGKHPKKTVPPDEWMKEWQKWSEQVTKAWIGDRSALEELSEMRR